MENYWWALTLLCSIISAGMILYNQIFKFDSTIVTIYRGLGVSIVLLPFIFLFEPIKGANFYILCAIQGIVIGYFDNRIFEASKKFGAGITSLAQPLTLMFTFFIWILIKPEIIDVLLSHKIKTCIIIASLISISICIRLLQKNKLNKKAMLFLVPSMGCIIFLDVMGKKIMSMGNGHIFSAIYFYALLTAFFAGLVNLIIFIKDKRNLNTIVTKNNLIKIAGPITFVVVATNILKMYSVSLVINPAYVGAILYASPVWIIIVNKQLSKYGLVNKYSTPKAWVVLLVVASAITLILAT